MKQSSWFRPMSFSLCRRGRWGTLSNALRKSKKTRKTSKPFSMSWRMLWKVDTSCNCGFPRAKPPLGSREKLPMAFYDTDFALDFILYRRMTGTSRVQEQHQDDLLLNSQVAGSRVCGRSSSRWSYRPRPLSRRLFFSTCASGIVLNELSVATVLPVWAQASQNSNMLHIAG